MLYREENTESDERHLQEDFASLSTRWVGFTPLLQLQTDLVICQWLKSTVDWLFKQYPGNIHSIIWHLNKIKQTLEISWESHWVVLSHIFTSCGNMPAKQTLLFEWVLLTSPRGHSLWSPLQRDCWLSSAAWSEIHITTSMKLTWTQCGSHFYLTTRLISFNRNCNKTVHNQSVQSLLQWISLQQSWFSSNGAVLSDSQSQSPSFKWGASVFIPWDTL